MKRLKRFLGFEPPGEYIALLYDRKESPMYGLLGAMKEVNKNDKRSVLRRS